MNGLLRGFSVVLFSQVVRIVAKGTLILLLTRYLLDPAGYGHLFLTLSVLGVLLLFASLGIPKAGARYIAEYGERSPAVVPAIIRLTVLFTGGTLALVCLGIAIFADRLAALAGEPSIAPLLLVGIGWVVGMSLSETAVNFFQGLNRMDWTAVIRVVSNVTLVAVVPLVLVLGYGLVGAMAGYALSQLLAALVGLAAIYWWYYRGRDPPSAADEGLGGRILRYSVPLTVAKGANVIDGRIDTILLGVFRGPLAVAYYTLGRQVAEFLIVPAVSLGFAISPTYGEQKAADEIDRAARLYERAFVHTLVFYGPVAAGVVLVATPAVEFVFGPAYANAGVVLQILSLFVFVRAIDMITSDALDFLGRATARATARTVFATANVGLNLVLIPPYGIVGATVATVITSALLVAVELAVIADELPIDLRRLGRASLVVIGITGVMAAAVAALTAHITDLPSLIGVICVGGAVWLLLTVLTGVIDIRQLVSAFT